MNQKLEKLAGRSQSALDGVSAASTQLQGGGEKQSKKVDGENGERPDRG